MKHKYAIFIGDQADQDSGKPWVVADLVTRIVLGTIDAVAYPAVTGDSVDSVVLRTRKKPVEFWLEDYKWYYEVRCWVEVTLLSRPR